MSPSYSCFCPAQVLRVLFVSGARLMTRTDSVRTPILAAMAAMMLGACVTTATTAQQPQLLSDTGAGGAISSGADMRPKRLAIVIDGSAASSFTTCTGEALDFHGFATGLKSAFVFADLFVSK